MKTKMFTAALLAAALALPIFAHDLFLKLDNYFVKANEQVTIKIMNGTFLASDGAVSYQRLRDISVVAPSGSRTKPPEADFTRDEKTAYLSLQPTEEGNYVVGLSTMTREIDLTGAEFNDYLSHDGIPDTLAERKRKNELNKDVRERYSKHVKTIFQVGQKQTDNYKTVLGYPVEIVPQTNPFKLKAGDTFEFVCLINGKPLVNQFVMSGREAGGKLVAGQEVRTDKKGIARVTLDGPGKWYVRFIHMVPLKDPKLNYESNWATLTFEIK